MEEIIILELFGGIGALTKAFKRLGIPHKVIDYVEIDKYAVASYNAINGTNFEPQDICNWNKDIEVDLIMHGSPCQDFSLAGRQAGGDEGSGTRSSLMYETIRIVEKLRPKYVIWENVKNIISKKHIHNFNNYIKRMEELGYTSYYQVLNAKDYGIPQNRERVFTISILENENFIFPSKKELKLKLEDMLEDRVNEKYYLSNNKINKIQYSEFAQEKTRIQKKDYCDTLLARDYKDPKCVEVDNKYYLSDKMKKYISKQGTANFKNPDCKINLNVARPLTTDPNKRAGTTNYICKELPVECNICDMDLKEYKIRKLTPKEYWRLMGFDDKDVDKASEVNSNTQLYKQAGNSIVVPVLEAILINLLLEPKQDVIEGQMSIYDLN